MNYSVAMKHMQFYIIWYLIAQSGIQISEIWDDSTDVPSCSANCEYLSQLSEIDVGANSSQIEEILYPLERYTTNWEMKNVSTRALYGKLRIETISYPQ